MQFFTESVSTEYVISSARLSLEMNTFVYSPYPNMIFVLPHLGHLWTNVSLFPQFTQFASKSYTEIVLSGLPFSSEPHPNINKQSSSSETSWSAS